MAKKKKSGYYTRMLKICRQQWSRNNAERKACFLNARSISVNKVTKWVCTECKHLFALSEIECDHIEPVRNTVPETMQEFFDSFTRLHVAASGLQILCKTCHKLKTKGEAEVRARERMIDYCNIQLLLFGHPSLFINMLSDKHLKALYTIIKNIEKFQMNAASGSVTSRYRQKLLKFIGTHG